MASNNNNGIEKRLWEAADQLRANSKLKSSEFSVPVLGLIFLRFADFKFVQAEKELKQNQQITSQRRATISKLDYQARGVMYLPDEACWKTLMNLSEDANIGKEINDAMRAIERENEDLKDILPKTYNRLENGLLFELLKNFNLIDMDIEGDVFGKIYEYFLGKFALQEGRGGGEFYTPTSIVKLIVEIIEPYHGRIYDPACGSGGMFVQSGNFVEHHKGNGKNHSTAMESISIYGQEKTAETARLCKMNLAVHGLSGDIRQANSYYEDLHNCVGKFDFVMANPPFNVDKIDKEKLKDDTRRFPFGMPRNDNGNYLWIQLFYSSLNETGRGGFVMANSASDAGQSEKELRRQLIESGAVDVIVSISPNFFYTVTLPVTLWFLDKGKRGTDRASKVLFLDARKVYTQIDRAHREFNNEQLKFLANIVRLFRKEDLQGYQVKAEHVNLSESQLKQAIFMFASNKYVDIKGLCKLISLSDLEDQSYSLNPKRYVGVEADSEIGDDYFEKLDELKYEFETLSEESMGLSESIKENLVKLINNSGQL